MSLTTHTNRLRDLTRVSLDRQAIYMAALFVVVQAGAIALALAIDGSSATVETPGGVDGPAAGAGWALAEVAFAVVFVGAIYGVRYLPEWLRDPLKTTVALGLVYLGGAVYQSWALLLVFLGVYLATQLINTAGYWWLVNNLLAVWLAIGGAAILGLALNEWALLTFLVGMTVYDHIFADRQGWMLAMAGVLVKYRLPVLFVKPSAYRFDWNDLFKEEGEALETSEQAWGIGSADLMLPAAFTVAVVTGSSVLLPLLAGAVVTAGVVLAALRIRRKMLTDGSGAGLPPLTAGVALAYAAVLVPSVVYSTVIA